MGDGNGDDCSCEWTPRSAAIAFTWPRTSEIEVLPLVEARGVLAALLMFESEGESLAGSGNKGPLSFFLRGRRKNVVVVDIVCVVVVCA